VSNLDGKIAVVTGAGTGIGRAAALLLARQGATVVVNGRRKEPLEETCALARERRTGKVVPMAADVSTEEGAEAIIAAARAEGGLDCLVNNAGVGWSHARVSEGSMAPLVDTPTARWHEVMRINLDSVYFMCKRAIPEFRKRGGGNIVNVSSIGGLQGMMDAHTYSAAKAGMINLTRSLAKTYGPENIRSNVVAPGITDTDMVDPVLGTALNPFENPATRYATCPLGRPGTPEEIAHGIVFLATVGTYCNGTVLVIDGGTSA
jgi:NAD(P)-dependent dehydrogenase (short-subunit alcohol dehydrogenase family)